MSSDEVVISGVSGRFPESANMKELRDNLLNNVNMVTTTERSFKSGVFGIPKGFGALKEINKFDAEFFGVHPKQASRMDPQLRLSLETTAEALFDAGINPGALRGSRTGVYVGVTSGEAYDMWTRQPSKTEGVTMVGCAKSMFANRISYTFDFRGPSCSYDTACSSSVIALEAAVSDIKSGKCDAAIVTGGNLILNPLVTLQFYKLGVLSRDSASKAFDESANGYARAEAVATIYLQRKCDAKRIYASIINIKAGTDGFKADGIATPSSTSLEMLLNRVYGEVGVNKKDVNYIECHGTGTQAGDLQEFLAIQRSFAESLSERSTPLKIGGVKSNLGHTEGASGICGIAKVLIMLQEGVIPANLHYKSPQLGMEYLHNGRITVVNENTKWDGGLIGLNSFGFGGVNVHMIIKPYEHYCASNPVIDTLPRIITLSGRTEEGVLSSLSKMEEENNMHMWNLSNGAYKSPIRGHLFRGYSIPGYQSPVVKAAPQEIQNPANLWLVFNGIGSQWDGMGKDLLQIPAFAESIKISADILQSAFDYDLMNALLHPEPSVMDTPLHCFVTIAAIQIGIVDILKKLGVQMQGFIGHSAGEMVCAYADECLTAQETIQCAYYRGASLARTNEGVEMSMAVIGATWEEVSATCPKGVYPACHNANTSVTVSGPQELINLYVADMKAKGLIAKLVNSCGQAFHSPYVEKSSHTFLANLMGLIKEPKNRSSKWTSSSVSERDWSTELALKASPEYFVNNFRNPVLFYDAVKCIPSNAVVVEIGPSGLLQGLIKKSAPKDTQIFALQSRDSGDGLLDFVTRLGHLFIAGVEMDVSSLYGDVQYPVPLGTSMISPHVTWDHSSNWDVPVFGQNGEFVEASFEVDISKEADKYLAGHQIQGRVLMPASGYLLLVWKFFASIHQIRFDKLPVVFENVKYTRVTVLRESGKVEFRINISDVSGFFEIKEGDAVIATGNIRRLINQTNNEMLISDEQMSELVEKHNKEAAKSSEFDLLKADIYKQFRFLGYEYGGYFVGIKRRYSSGKFFSVDWNNNWVAFLDVFSQTQMGLFGLLQTKTKLPTEFAKLVISPQTLLDYFANNLNGQAEKNGVLVYNDEISNTIRCPGLELQRWKFTPIQDTGREPVPSLCSYKFRPFLANKTEKSILNPMLQCIQVIADNIPHHLFTMPQDVVEFTSSPDDLEPLKTQQVFRVDCAVPDVNYNVYTNVELPEDQTEAYLNAGVLIQPLAMMEWTDGKYKVVISDGTIKMEELFPLVSEDGFIIVKYPLHECTAQEVESKCEAAGLTLIAHETSSKQDVFLARKAKDPRPKNIKVVPILSKSLEWVEQLRDIAIAQEEMGDNKPKVYLISNGEEEYSGIIGLINCIRKEPFCHQIRAIFSKKPIDLDFESPSPLLAKIIAQDLVITVVDSEGDLGSFVYSPVPIGKDVDCKNAFVGMDTVGDLSTLRWIQAFSYDQLHSSYCPGFLPVQVKVAALNFKDIMLASGSVQPEKRPLPFKIESSLGIEFAGETTDGTMVAGFADGQALATDVLGSTNWIWKVPKSWSMENAATIPVAYSTAYLALFMRGQIQNGESILIHAGSGGVGQAAIRIALSMNCEVFTTVESEEKREFIRKTFPKIPSANIGSYRDTTFEKLVLEATSGRGVDLVLNSLTGDLLEASTRCLARHGRFLDIGKADLASNQTLGMNFFLQDTSYHGVMFDSLWSASPGTRRRLWQMVQDGLDSGAIIPLPHKSFGHDQVEQAFRFMASGKHIGKVLINLQNIKKLHASPRVYFDPTKSYIVIGGLGGMALEFVNWMITRHARKLILATRTGITNGYQANYVKIWRDAGADVHVLTLDAADPVQAAQLLNEAENLGPVGGFFNLAMHMNIDLMKSQTVASFAHAMDPKYALTLNMDKLTREKCHALDHFVGFSSVAVGFGFPGQTNYGFANSAMERIMEKRNEDGFPGKAIQFGPVGEVGKWHEHYNSGFELKKYQGHGVQSIGSILKAMDTLLTDPAPVMLSRQTITVDSGSRFAKKSLGIVERIGYVLGHSSTQNINQNVKLAELGMDSVTATEVKQMLEHDFYLVLSGSKIRTSTLMELKELAVSQNTKAKN